MKKLYYEQELKAGRIKPVKYEMSNLLKWEDYHRYELDFEEQCVGDEYREPLGNGNYKMRKTFNDSKKGLKF